MSTLQITRHTVQSDKISRSLTFALVADLHNGAYEAALPAVREADAILILGDLINRHRDGYARALQFLHDAPQIAPTFYAIGNHEQLFPQRAEYWPHVKNSAVTILDNAFTQFEGVTLGGSVPMPEMEQMRPFCQIWQRRAGLSC